MKSTFGNHTEKGLEYDLEVASKKRERALKDLKLRISAANTSLREGEDLIKLNFLKDGLEADLNNFKTIHEKVTDLLIRLGLVDTEQTMHDEYTITNNAVMECLADLKANIKDLELERAELLSQRSSRSKKSYSNKSGCTSSTTSSKFAAIEAAKLEQRMIGLQKRQEIERRRDELQIQQRELERIGERERLEEELLTAKSVQKILQEECFDPRDKEVIDRSPWELPARSETADPSAPLSPSIDKESAVQLKNKARLHASEAALQSEDYLSSARKETLPESRNELPSRRNRVSFPTHLDVKTPTISETDIPRALLASVPSSQPDTIISKTTLENAASFVHHLETQKEILCQVITCNTKTSIFHSLPL